ncbi:MAG: hypothetical protein V7L05_10795, partial [Nostoc sp.]|uniref:hypothetical protein n=1 Tax=Nostoc sp. TaxID=1180 RepID=UPI002FFC5C29
MAIPCIVNALACIVNALACIVYALACIVYALACIVYALACIVYASQCNANAFPWNVKSSPVLKTYVFTQNCTKSLNIKQLVESMGDIIPRTSQLDPCVPVSVYTAPDVLS